MLEDLVDTLRREKEAHANQLSDALKETLKAQDETNEIRKKYEELNIDKMKQITQM